MVLHLIKQTHKTMLSSWISWVCNLNDCSIEMYREHPNKIPLSLSRNTKDEVIQLLREHPDKINWHALSGNTNDNAIQLLREHPDKINWHALSGNPNVSRSKKNTA